MRWPTASRTQPAERLVNRIYLSRVRPSRATQTARARRRGLPCRARRSAARPVLVVGDRVEEVVLAGVELRVEHGAECAEHGPAAVLEEKEAGRRVFTQKRFRAFCHEGGRSCGWLGGLDGSCFFIEN